MCQTPFLGSFFKLIACISLPTLHYKNLSSSLLVSEDVPISKRSFFQVRAIRSADDGSIVQWDYGRIMRSIESRGTRDSTVTKGRVKVSERA